MIHVLMHITKLNKCITLIELKHVIVSITKIPKIVFMVSFALLSIKNKNLEFNCFTNFQKILIFICMNIKLLCVLLIILMIDFIVNTLIINRTIEENQFSKVNQFIILVIVKNGKNTKILKNILKGVVMKCCGVIILMVGKNTIII